MSIIEELCFITAFISFLITYFYFYVMCSHNSGHNILYVPFSMLLYIFLRQNLYPCTNLLIVLYYKKKDMQIAHQMFDVALSCCPILENQH